MIPAEFADMRPFEPDELPAAYEELLGDPTFRKIAAYVFPDIPFEHIAHTMRGCKTCMEFQAAFCKPFLKGLVARCATSLSGDFSAVNPTPERQNYTYISNHRDIVLDSGLLDLLLIERDLSTVEIAIGDNLVPEPLFLTIAKANKMFLVKRSGASLREKLLNSKELSEYIHQGMTVEKESVWIAQRNGRTKNGIDLTQQGLLKMLAYYDENRDVLDILQEMNLTPLTVSYEYEPCDQLKARELALSEKEKYVKKPGEDFNSICQGIFGFKGEVHLVIGQPINDEIAQIDRSIRKNDKLTAVARIIDQQIYSNYHLYATNYIAYDCLEQCNKFAEYYTEKQKEEFLQYIHKQSIIEDVSAEKMENYLLNIYANPVKTKIGGNIIPIEENDW